MARPGPFYTGTSCLRNFQLSFIHFFTFFGPAGPLPHPPENPNPFLGEVEIFSG